MTTWTSTSPFPETEHLFSILEKGKGILVMASHFGNWELMSLAFSMRYRPFYVVMRPLDNRRFEQVGGADAHTRRQSTHYQG